MPIVEAQGLSIGYGGTPLMRGLDFGIERGDVFLVLGGSGTGKSTLLKTMFGRLAPVAGSVRIDGAGDPALLDGQRPRFGVSFQAGALFGSMTVAENVALPLERWTGLGPEAISAIVDGKLRLVGLGEAGHRLPSELSGGMQKRAGIARALALETDLLFLDEPSAGLDPIMSAELDELLLTLNQALGITLVIVTHELASIEAIGTRCILLDRDAKTSIATGAPRELAESSDDPRVQAFFHRTSGRKQNAMATNRMERT